MVDGQWKNDPNETLVINNYGSSDNTIQVILNSILKYYFKIGIPSSLRSIRG
jgi:hypothetical protein